MLLARRWRQPGRKIFSKVIKCWPCAPLCSAATDFNKYIQTFECLLSKLLQPVCTAFWSFGILSSKCYPCKERPGVNAVPCARPVATEKITSTTGRPLKTVSTTVQLPNTYLIIYPFISKRELNTLILYNKSRSHKRHQNSHNNI